MAKKKLSEKGVGPVDFLIASLQSPFLGPIYAAIAGVLTSASPCSLAAIPLVIGHMAGAEGRGKTGRLLLFLSGMALSLTAVGILAGALGRSLILTVPWLRPLAGVAFIVAGAAYMDLFGGKKTCKVNLPLDKIGSPEEESAGNIGTDGTQGAKTAGGAKGTEGIETVRASGSPITHAFTSFSLGALYGVTASPCATPALLAILSLVAVTGSLWKGALLLLSYSIGQSALILAAGLFTIRFRDFLGKKRNSEILEIVRKGGGVVIMAFGAYLLARPYL